MGSTGPRFSRTRGTVRFRFGSSTYGTRRRYWWPRLRVRISRGADTAAESAVDHKMWSLEEMPSEVTELKAPVT